MGWRTLHISQQAKLSLKYDALVLDNGEVFTIPLNDLACVVIESRMCTLTAPLIDALSACGATVFVCDEKHMPSSIMLPFHAHSRQSGMARMQTAWSEPFRKRCWQSIIQAKVTQQAALLEPREPMIARDLRALYKKINSGDTLNIEAQAARLYWSALFEDFARKHTQDDVRNSALNYGYAIMRGMVARALVGAGFLPTFGLHHDNALNAFNLADDMIEPFRPFVDGIVRELLDEDAQMPPLSLPMRYKTRLLELVITPCRFGAVETTLPHACDLAAQSLARATQAKDPSLLETAAFL